VRFFNGGGTPVTLDGGGDLLRHRGIRGEVRRGSVEIEEAARVELTEVGGKTVAAAMISRETGGAPVTGLDKR
jgi:hypothetical protein